MCSVCNTVWLKISICFVSAFLSLLPFIWFTTAVIAILLMVAVSLRLMCSSSQSLTLPWVWLEELEDGLDWGWYSEPPTPRLGSWRGTCGNSVMRFRFRYSSVVIAPCNSLTPSLWCYAWSPLFCKPFVCVFATTAWHGTKTLLKYFVRTPCDGLPCLTFSCPLLCLQNRESWY